MHQLDSLSTQKDTEVENRKMSITYRVHTDAKSKKKQ